MKYKFAVNFGTLSIYIHALYRYLWPLSYATAHYGGGYCVQSEDSVYSITNVHSFGG